MILSLSSTLLLMADIWDVTPCFFVLRSLLPLPSG